MLRDRKGLLRLVSLSPPHQLRSSRADSIAESPVSELARGRGAQKGRAGGGEQVLSVQKKVQGLP